LILEGREIRPEPIAGAVTVDLASGTYEITPPSAAAGLALQTALNAPRRRADRRTERLSGTAFDATFCPMTTVPLTPEQERFVADAVAQGRYRDASEVVQASLALLRSARLFIASLQEAEAESEREGSLKIEDVHREMSDLIDELARRRTRCRLPF
jgi:antitoxin ParD1/3/4